ncbi:MAG TPA: hypothetical protein VFP34_07130 [Microlunatus sp.]|nr:hypothetical protein [Microlunatus sp.]
MRGGPAALRRWHAHDVRTHGEPESNTSVGDLELADETLDLRAEPGLALTVYSAAPGSPTALALLASWAASGQRAITTETNASTA